MEDDSDSQYDERLDKIIKRRFTASFMSNSKWRRFFTVLDVESLHITQAVWKLIDDETEIRDCFSTPDDFFNDGIADYGVGPIAFKHIEWIEIPKKGIPSGFEQIPFKHWDQDIAEAERLLRSVGQFEIEHTDRGLKILGYKLKE